MAKRKTKNQGGLSVERAREIVARVKKMEGLSEHTIFNYNKLFNDLERCFAKNKYMENFSVSDARRFLEENPMAIKNIKDQEKQVETLTAEELKLILKSLDHSWFVDFRAAVLIHVLLDSFGRIGKGQGNSMVVWKLKERIASTRAFHVFAISLPFLRFGKRIGRHR